MYAQRLRNGHIFLHLRYPFGKLANFRLLCMVSLPQFLQLSRSRVYIKLARAIWGTEVLVGNHFMMRSLMQVSFWSTCNSKALVFIHYYFVVFTKPAKKNSLNFLVQVKNDRRFSEIYCSTPSVRFAVRLFIADFNIQPNWRTNSAAVCSRSVVTCTAKN